MQNQSGNKGSAYFLIAFTVVVDAAFVALFISSRKSDAISWARHFCIWIGAFIALLLMHVDNALNVIYRMKGKKTKLLKNQRLYRICCGIALVGLAATAVGMLFLV